MQKIQKKYRYNTKSKMSLNYEKIKAMVLKDTRYRISPGLDFEGWRRLEMKEAIASKVEGRGLARSDAIDHGRGKLERRRGSSSFFIWDDKYDEFVLQRCEP